jgi:capsular polysaccharide transport system permease protein
VTDQTLVQPIGGIGRSLAARLRITFAIVLRQMKIKAGEERFGYAMEIIEPVLLISMMSLMMSFTRGVPPIGDSYPLFYATGYLPFKAFSFISNDTRRSLGRDSGVTEIPLVQHTDALLASFFLKALTTMVIMGLVAVFLNAVGFTIIPQDPLSVMAAFFWLSMFAFGFGLTTSVLGEVIPLFSYVNRILNFKLLLISGVFFLPESMPPEIRYWISFNPLLHAISWYRSAFMHYNATLLDKGFLIFWSMVLTCFGLLALRVLRSRMSED